MGAVTGDKRADKDNQVILRFKEVAFVIGKVYTFLIIAFYILLKIISMGRVLYYDFDMNFYEYQLSAESKFLFTTFISAVTIGALITALIIFFMPAIESVFERISIMFFMIIINSKKERGTGWLIKKYRSFSAWLDVGLQLVVFLLINVITILCIRKSVTSIVLKDVYAESLSALVITAFVFCYCMSYVFSDFFRKKR